MISAGHCVTVREEKPAVDLETEQGVFTLNLEKPASAAAVLEALGGEVVKIITLIELTDLKGRKAIEKYPFESIISYEGE